ncbi:MAG: hypothetical protein J0M12_08690 [Deltaproteobacteria bacterium]|nr:hypothetical protein [Deltaproteobacteria bacterium]
MVNIFIVIASLLLPSIHLALSRVPRTRGRVIRILLIYSLVLNVGVIGFFFGFIPHVFFADRAARLIGWPPGSPFQFEVGVHDGAWGMLGFLCIWFGGSFRVATGAGWSFFMLGATYGHIRDTVLSGNYAPYNFLMIFVDGFVAVWLLTLLFLDYRWNKCPTSSAPCLAD